MVSSRLRDFARGNRKSPTLAERILWQELRGRALGVRFRREDPIGPFIADFSCRGRRVVIEVDGASHHESTCDAERDAWFRLHGWRVLRVLDEDVLDDLDTTLDAIDRAIHEPGRGSFRA